MNSEEKIAVMFALIEEQRKAVNQSINDLNDGIKRIKTLSEAEIYIQTSKSIGELQKDAQEALNASVEPFETKMDIMDGKANKIAQSLTDVSDRLSSKVFLLVMFACLVCIAAVAITSYVIGKDVARLRTEQIRLQANVKALEDAGGKIYIGDCDGELCVRVDPNRKSYTHTATGLPMYFVK